MATYRYAQIPAHGQRIEYADGTLTVPDNPISPFTEIASSAFGDQLSAGMR
jgi:hypothetical protein